ncbi:heme exporter protein CcmD [Pseudochrobactrum sp. MP213Fo]|uniref:heme exporter protein CcmD n=1 Tax=Pseudochrobactrum sp. MP213Fo TaxID=3022250 RepID=UPI003B9E4303
MSHLTYVMLAYGISAVVVLAILAWIVLTQNNLQAEMTRLEKQGIRRRSQQTTAPEKAD